MGEMIALQPDQYRYGLNPIVVKVLEVLARVQFDGGAWLSVRVMVADGNPDQILGGWRERELYIPMELLDIGDFRGFAT
jgi:hypothetical protein